MNGEHWLTRQMREASQDPKLQEIKRMLEEVVVINSPEMIVPLKDVREFDVNATHEGLIDKNISQGNLWTTIEKPIRTDNAADCNIFLIKHRYGDKNAYTMVHVWAGDMDLNRDGAQRSDIATLTGHDGTAIAITGSRSVTMIPTARELKHEGITTRKHINVASGNRYISVVYKPRENKILIRIGSDQDATEVYVYEGF